MEAFKAKLPLLVQTGITGVLGHCAEALALACALALAWACELACACAWFCASCWLRLLVALAEAEALAVAVAEVPLAQLAEAVAEAEAVAVAVKVPEAGDAGVLQSFTAKLTSWRAITLPLLSTKDAVLTQLPIWPFVQVLVWLLQLPLLTY